MSEVQSQEEFEVLHQTTYKDLQLDYADLTHFAKAQPVSPVIPELVRTLSDILTLVSPDGPVNPDVIFRNGLEAMELINAKRFVLDNLLEGLKKGEQPEVLMQRYVQLGLLNAQQPQSAAPVAISPDTHVMGDVNKGTRLLRQWGLATAQIIANAIRTIPKFVEIEPTISLVGPIPVISFALKGKGMSIHALFEALRVPGRFYRK